MKPEFFGLHGDVKRSEHKSQDRRDSILRYSGARLSRRPRGMKNGAEITDHRVKRKPIWRQNINMRLKFLYIHDVR